MIKQFESYQRLASKTASYKDPDYLPLGLTEECGELVHEYARCKEKLKDIERIIRRLYCWALYLEWTASVMWLLGIEIF
jgi:NTP pyrophosphatase (non-canonical NTP hydrolase)